MTATSTPVRSLLIDTTALSEPSASTTNIRGEKTTFHDVLARTTTEDLSTKAKLATKVVDARDDQQESQNNDHDRTKEKSDTDSSTPSSMVMPSPVDLQNNTAADIAGAIKSHRSSSKSAPIESGSAPRAAGSSGVRGNERATTKPSGEVHLAVALSSPGSALEVPDEAVTRLASAPMATEGGGSVAKSGTLKNAPHITVKSAKISSPQPQPTAPVSAAPDLTKLGLSSSPGRETLGAPASTKAIAPSVRTAFDTNNRASSRTTSDTTAPAPSDVPTNSESVASGPPITNWSQVDMNLSSAHHANDVMPGVASQLVQVLAPLRQTNTGGHAVTIALHPEGLGSVKATVISTADQTVVRLSAMTSEGASAIRSALPELHNNLATMSNHTTTVLLTNDSSQSASTFGDTQQQTNAGTMAKAERRGTESVDVTETATVTRTSTSNLLDVRI